jgi:nucleoside-diphosphate-sugar epimerase
VFVAGGTGYIGRPLIQWLLNDGHIVRALARLGSENGLPSGCQKGGGGATHGRRWGGKAGAASAHVDRVDEGG